MPLSFAERMRAFGWFLIAAFYFLLAQLIASHAARGLAPGDSFEVVNRAILLFLLLLGYAGMGRVGQQQRSPLRAMGLGLRPGWLLETALGAALGWGGIVACVLPIAVVGEMALKFDAAPHQLLLLLIDLATLAIAALAEEVAFRGYPFQRLIEATGPTSATLLVSLIFMAAHLSNPDASSASLITTLVAGWLLALAYLRTRALWVCWGFHFGWNASMGLLFGLPVSGLTIFSPVISAYTRGPVWLTGGGYGPEGSAVAIVVLFILLFILVRSTRALKYQYAGPTLIAGGIPVDIDALARKEHERGVGPGATAHAEQQLVQIAPAATPARHVLEDGPDAD